MHAKNVDYASRVRSIVEDANFTRSLGLALESVTPGQCVTSLTIVPDHWQQDAYVHAGVQTTMADHTAGSAAYSLVAADELVLTAELKVNLLRPARGERLVCRAEVLRPGRVLTVVESAVFVTDGADERLCAKALVTLTTVPAPA